MEGEIESEPLDLKNLPAIEYKALYKKGKMRIKNLKVKIKNLDIIMPKVVKACSDFYNS